MLNSRFQTGCGLMVALVGVLLTSGCADTSAPQISLTEAPSGTAEVLTTSGAEGAQVDHEDGTFHEIVDQAAPVVLLDFWGPHCGPCRMLAPELEKVAARFPERVSIVKVDVESADNAGLARHFGVRAIPDMRVYVQGQPELAMTGYRRSAQIIAALEAVLPATP